MQHKQPHCILDTCHDVPGLCRPRKLAKKKFSYRQMTIRDLQLPQPSFLISATTSSQAAVSGASSGKL